MIVSFGDNATEAFYNGDVGKKAWLAVPKEAAAKARRLLDQLEAARDLRDLAAPPSNRLEPLKGDRKGQYSLRIDKQWRVVFRWEDSGAHDVSIVDYHGGSLCSPRAAPPLPLVKCSSKSSSSPSV